MKKKLLLFIFLAVLINICWKCSRASIYYYKIPYANKMLTIYIPALSDTAYAYIGTHKMEARYDDDRFYVESTEYWGLYNIKPGYVEISIKDYAMFVVCRVDSTSQFSELKRNSVVSIK